ncbi:hypothetical protein SAMD00019534_046370 [Acytostelium subglobosum LB1]|uniref:hypothetical protein n=1 Tax=Acytostelium subglobosum LB1 TaxID=1410327 RepID=UPI0006448F8D|nr:hypothetical protein SAMD00019534_046370 [Acytostelium subglobosum LB1]GAM21462.1 hypothetical protein SAMD00019534_046370 [Acytostelium subglobosum LB1]|eukprot:XP_012755581.1 hypothetical protein SAMD00019534_046370 [Acytostelium subglobosum LB1]
MSIDDHIYAIASIFETISSPVDKQHWYLSPEYHATEFIYANVSYLMLIYFAYILILRGKSTIPVKGVQKHHIICTLVGIVLLINVALNIYYKPNKMFGNRNYYYMLQPCHVLSVIYAYLLLTNDAMKNTKLFKVTIHYVFFTVSALAFPDLTDLDQPFECHNFFIQHYALLIAPFLIQIYKTPVEFSAGYALFSSGLILMIHHTLFQVCAFISGINLNYMLYPPPLGFDLNDAVQYLSSGYLAATHYRLILGPICTAVSFPMSYLIIKVGNLISSGVYGFKPKHYEMKSSKKVN